MDRPAPATLIHLPVEVFTLIADRLPRWDKASLMTVCKATHALTEPSLYSDNVVKNKASCAAFSDNLASRPHLCELVRSYSVSGRDID
jgi:hypothetical protein